MINIITINHKDHQIKDNNLDNQISLKIVDWELEIIIIKRKLIDLFHIHY